MRCRQCRKRYPANQSSPAPGGFSSPGELLIAGAVLEALAFGVYLWRPAWKPPLLVAGGALGLLFLIATLVSWRDCQGAAGFFPTGGETCPFCNAKNTVWPWSL